SSIAFSNSGAGISVLVSVTSSLISPSVSIIAITSPTCTTSSTLNRFSTKIPSTSQGTSLSTLSVATSKTASSISIVSPTSFNQEVIVASATLSPIFGNLSSNFAIYVM